MRIDDKRNNEKIIMPARIPEQSLAAIEKVVAHHPDGASFGDVAEALTERLADRTLQYRLKYLVDRGRLIKTGEGRRWTRYQVPAPKAKPTPAAAITAAPEKTEDVAVPLSAAAQEVRWTDISDEIGVRPFCPRTSVWSGFSDVSD